MSARLHDRFGLPLSTTSSLARDLYVEGVDRLLSQSGGASAPLARAAEADPGFSLAHIARALALLERMDAAAAAEAREKALSVLAGVDARERAHVEGIAMLLRGEEELALPRLVAHARAFPRDALVVEQLQRFFFFHGGVGRKERVLELLEGSRELSGDWWFDAKLAFHLQESGELADAERRAHASLAARPDNAAAVHALAHARHGRRAHRDASKVVEAALPSVDASSSMRGHLVWHVAIAALAAGEIDRAVSLYESEVRPSQSRCARPLALADAVGFLSVLTLVRPESVPRHAWGEAHAVAQTLARRSGKPFVDVHAAVAMKAVGDIAGLRALRAALEEQAASGHALAAAVGAPVVAAVCELAEGNGRAALARLDALSAAERAAMGGSEVERSLVDEIRIEAARLAGATVTIAETSLVHPVLGQLSA